MGQQRSDQRLQLRPRRRRREVVVDEFESRGHEPEHAARLLARETRGDCEVIGGGMPARANQGPFVLDQRQPFWRAERRLDLRRHRPKHLRGALAVRK